MPPTDYDPVIFMIENTLYHADPDSYYDIMRDVGTDGIFRENGIMPEREELCPYGATRKYYGNTSEGLEKWVFEQDDHPGHFARLLRTIEESEVKRIQLVAESPAEYAASTSPASNANTPSSWELPVRARAT